MGRVSRNGLALLRTLQSKILDEKSGGNCVLYLLLFLRYGLSKFDGNVKMMTWSVAESVFLLNYLIDYLLITGFHIRKLTPIFLKKEIQALKAKSLSHIKFSLVLDIKG